MAAGGVKTLTAAQVQSEIAGLTSKLDTVKRASMIGINPAVLLATGSTTTAVTASTLNPKQPPPPTVPPPASATTTTAGEEDAPPPPPAAHMFGGDDDANDGSAPPPPIPDSPRSTTSISANSHSTSTNSNSGSHAHASMGQMHRHTHADENEPDSDEDAVPPPPHMNDTGTDEDEPPPPPPKQAQSSDASATSVAPGSSGAAPPSPAADRSSTPTKQITSPTADSASSPHGITPTSPLATGLNSPRTGAPPIIPARPPSASIAHFTRGAATSRAVGPAPPVPVKTKPVVPPKSTVVKFVGMPMSQTPKFSSFDEPTGKVARPAGSTAPGSKPQIVSGGAYVSIFGDATAPVLPNVGKAVATPADGSSGAPPPAMKKGVSFGAGTAADDDDVMGAVSGSGGSKSSRDLLLTYLKKHRRSTMAMKAGREGWLEKKGGNSLFGTKWQRRWFVAKDNVLYYYESDIGYKKVSPTACPPALCVLKGT